MQDPWEQIAIESAKGGDTRVWTLLYEAHVGAVFQYGLRLTYGRQDMVEELTQETFVGASGVAPAKLGVWGIVVSGA